MSNPIFVFEGVRVATLAASAGSVAGYPTLNLQDDRHATMWWSGGVTANQTFAATFTAAKNIDCCLVAHHNFANLGLTSLDIEVSTNGSDWTQVASLTNFPDPLYVAFTSVSKAIVRLKFVKGSALSDPPYMGLLYFGTRADLPLYNNSPERGLQGDAVIAESMSGLRYASSLRADRESWKIDLGRFKVLDYYNFLRLLRAVNGMQYPFWFCDMDGNWHFVRFKKNYLPLVGKGNIIFSARGIEFDEERVGIAMSLPGNYTVPAPEGSIGELPPEE